MNEKIRTLLILGCGYVGEKLAMACMQQGMRVIATTRNEARAAELERIGVEAVVVLNPREVLINSMNGNHESRIADPRVDHLINSDAIASDSRLGLGDSESHELPSRINQHLPSKLPDVLLTSVDAVVDSIPLTRDESGMFASQPAWLPEIAAKLSNLQWAGYLSTTGVYGNADGAWVDESWPCSPGSARGRQRLIAEQAWLNSGLPAEVFRLAGIYGAERNIVSRLKAGGYKAVKWNPPHYSSRIHVDDIVAALMAAMKKPRAGRIVNLADDFPCPHSEYVIELAELIGAPQPQILTAEEGEKELSPAMLDFFRDSKRLSNRLLHEELLPVLKHPGFRDFFIKPEQS